MLTNKELMKYEEERKGLEKISQTVGSFPDYVQGGGGNTSVKLDDRLMAVKASGYRLNQITPSDGYVIVDYRNIKGYFQKVDLSSGIDYEKDSTEFMKSSVIPVEGMKSLRPSVEAGFHSILQKYVIHSHSVYSNILCCAVNGREQVEKILGPQGHGFLWIPYINPGFSLTLKIQEEMDRYVQKNGRTPNLVFMENHGLIVHADCADACLKLHEEVNRLIRKKLGLEEAYPEILVKQLDENTAVSQTKYLLDFFKSNKVDYEFFERVLYPDQLVYLNGCINLDENGSNKLNISPSTGEILYKTGYGEARTIEETLAAFLYVTGKIEEKGLVLKTMAPHEIDFIKNWESERYRKTLAK